MPLHKATAATSRLPNYSRTGSDGTLDNQFIASGSQLASVRLLYRQDVGDRKSVV